MSVLRQWLRSKWQNFDWADRSIDRMKLARRLQATARTFHFLDDFEIFFDQVVFKAKLSAAESAVVMKKYELLSGIDFENLDIGFDLISHDWPPRRTYMFLMQNRVPNTMVGLFGGDV